MIKVYSTNGGIPGPQLKQGSTADNTFAELLAQQNAKPRHDGESSDADDDYLNERDREESVESMETEETDAREELIKLLSMSSAERIRYTMLKQMGLTEESLAQLPYEERERIERMIEQEIKRQLGGNYDETQSLREV